MQAWAWLDRDRAMGLKGVPVGIKDVIDTEGIPTENGSALHAGRVPERSAEVVVNLERAGFSVLGMTVTAELAFFPPGPTRNPWSPDRTPGDSSVCSPGGGVLVLSRTLDHLGSPRRRITNAADS